MAIEHVASRTQANSVLQTYTFNDVPLGEAADDRYIFVTARGLRGNQTLTVTNITVNGAATSEVVQAASGLACVAIRRTTAPLTAGATGTVVVTFNNPNGSSGCHIDVYSATDLETPDAYDTANPLTTSGNTITATIDVPRYGHVIAAAMGVRSASNSFLGSGASGFFESEETGLGVTPTHGAGGIGWSGLAEDSESSFYAGAAGVNYMYLAAASFALVGASDGSAEGSSTAAASGRGTARGSAAADGSASASAPGGSVARGAAVSAGHADAAASGRSLARSTGQSASVSTASAVGVVPAGIAAGHGAALAAGRSEARGEGGSSGLSSVSADGRPLARGAGVAAGAGTGSAAGRVAARGKGSSAGVSAVLAFPPPAGLAGGAGQAVGVGRATTRASGMSSASAEVLGRGQGVRRFFVVADDEGRFDFDHEGELPPGDYVARARAISRGQTTGWSDPVTVTVSA